MIGYLGYTSSLIGLTAAVVGCVAALRGSPSTRMRWPARAAAVAFVALLAANLLMVGGLVTHDFSIAYVAQVGSRATPLLYSVASLWGALEGSILFWSLLLAGAAVLVVLRISPNDRALLPVALAVLLGLLAFFVVIVLGPGDPWARLDPPPPDGPGPNPLLQNHPLMAFHPPLLYLGFVGLSVPYALTIAALAAGRLDGRWLWATRRWTLGPWILLTLGLLAGAWWSYAVLGWGGYWAWDPVENVALLPWLTATAFLHSAMVQARRGNLRDWNLLLVSASFLLTILATLVTRSGILNSVHSFTESVIGPLFLALFVAMVGLTLYLAAIRAPDRPAGRPELGPRTTGFLLNNLLLVAVATTILIGTLFPLFVEAASGAQVSVGTPYFERVLGPMALALVVLLGIGPALPWQGADAKTRRKLIPGALAATVVALVIAGLGRGPEFVVGAAAGTFALVQSLAYLVERLSSRRGALEQPLHQRLRSHRRSLGGLLVHAAIALIAIAVIVDAAGRSDAVVTLHTGDTTTFGSDRIELVDLRAEVRPDRSLMIADLAVSGSRSERVGPALSWFGNAQEPVATPSVLASPVSDLYVVMTAVDPGGNSATLRLMDRPMVSWIWVAGILAALGGLLAAWPTRSRATAHEKRAPSSLGATAAGQDP